jgi:hypothetical protein
VILDQNSNRNFPHVLRPRVLGVQTGEWLNLDYTFVGVAYRKKVQPLLPGLFSTLPPPDNQAFAEGFLFVPRRRPVDIWYNQWGPYFIYNNYPRHWDLWNENWTFQLVPALSASIPTILQTAPDTPQAAAAGSMQLPALNGLDTEDFRRMTTH